MKQPNQWKGVPWNVYVYGEGYVIDEHLKTRFMMLKEVKTEIIFGTVKIQPKELKGREGHLANQ